MDHLFSMRKIVLFACWAVLALLSVRDASAAAPVMMWVYEGQYYSNPTSACTAKDASSGTTFSRYEWQTTAQTGVWCYGKRASDGAVIYTGAIGTANRCADGTAPNTTKPLAQQCADPNPGCPAADTAGPGIDYTTGWRTGTDGKAAWATPQTSGYDQNYCMGTCIVKADDVTDCGTETTKGANGYYRSQCDYTTKYTGEPCSAHPELKTPSASGPPEPTAPPPEPNRCPLGTKQTGTDSEGIPICTGDKPNVDPAKKTTTTKTTNPDGSTTETTTEETTNSDGSKTTKTTTKTTNADGSGGGTTESTTTGKTPDGKDGKSDGRDEDKGDLCKQNPNLTICKNSQVSGECESVSCEGDAIQCAIYRQQQKEYCENKKESSARTLGESILAGNDPLKDQLPKPGNGSTFALGDFSQAPFLSSACVQNLTVANGVVIPLSQICEHILPLRYAIMTIAALVAFSMLRSHVFKG